MARASQPSTRRAPKPDDRRGGRKKVCVFCEEHLDWVDYTDVTLLRRFMSERGTIRARRVSGNCAQHQRDIAVAVKTARELALLPYAQRTVAERGAGRGGRGPGGSRGPRPEVTAPEVTAPEAVSGDGAEAAGVTEEVGDLAVADLVASGHGEA